MHDETQRWHASNGTAERFRGVAGIVTLPGDHLIEVQRALRRYSRSIKPQLLCLRQPERISELAVAGAMRRQRVELQVGIVLLRDQRPGQLRKYRVPLGEPLLIDALRVAARKQRETE